MVTRGHEYIIYYYLFIYLFINNSINQCNMKLDTQSKMNVIK